MILYVHIKSGPTFFSQQVTSTHTHMLIYIYIIHAHMLPSYTMMKHDGSWGLEPHARTPKSYCRSHLDCRKAARFSLWKTKHRKVGKWNILDIIGIGRYHLYHPGKHFWGGLLYDWSYNYYCTTAILGQTERGGGVRSQSVLVERGFHFRHFFGAVSRCREILVKIWSLFGNKLPHHPPIYNHYFPTVKIWFACHSG